LCKLNGDGEVSESVDKVVFGSEQPERWDELV